MMKDLYDDIINLPHHVSLNRKHLSIDDRAAQFSAFAALKGYDEEIDEAARLTEERVELEGDRAEELNEKLLLLCEHAAAHPAMKLTYFRPDEKKSGGKYLTAQGNLKKVDMFNRTLTLQDGLCVPFDDIFEIELN